MSGAITITGAPAGEGRDVLLVATGTEALELRKSGRLALGPATVAALADIAQVFPGARVLEFRHNQQRGIVPHTEK